MALRTDDFKTFESYKVALRKEASHLTSGLKTKFWIYKNVELPDSIGNKRTFATFIVLADERTAQHVVRGKSLVCKGICGLDSGRVVFVANSGKLPFDLLKSSVPALLGKPVHVPSADEDPPPDYSHIDVDRVKKLVAELWSGKRLVKVVSAKRGPLSAVEGYITLERSIDGQDCIQMARRLGLPMEIVKDGVYVMVLKRLPTPGEFELRGYTNTPQGKSYTPGGRADYPPGSGVPQWKLIRSVPAEPIRSRDGKPKVFLQGEPYKP